tara:strand:+ start:1188 stop:1559 length:372 start_codon:yes stop_codon:yes gene_type:complete
MAKTSTKKLHWLKKRIRTKNILKNTKGEYSRLVVFRSNKHIYCQLIDDLTSKTLVSSSTKDKALSKKVSSMTKIEQGKFVGEDIAGKIKKSKVKKVVFDRNGYKYHGRVKALGDAIRDQGIKF